MSLIYVACIDAEQLELQSGGPTKIGFSIISLDKKPTGRSALTLIQKILKVYCTIWTPFIMILK